MISEMLSGAIGYIIGRRARASETERVGPDLPPIGSPTCPTLMTQLEARRPQTHVVNPSVIDEFGGIDLTKGPVFIVAPSSGRYQVTASGRIEVLDEPTEINGHVVRSGYRYHELNGFTIPAPNVSFRWEPSLATQQVLRVRAASGDVFVEQYGTVTPLSDAYTLHVPDNSYIYNP